MLCWKSSSRWPSGTAAVWLSRRHLALRGAFGRRPGSPGHRPQVRVHCEPYGGLLHRPALCHGSHITGSVSAHSAVLRLSAATSLPFDDDAVGDPPSREAKTAAHTPSAATPTHVPWGPPTRDAEDTALFGFSGFSLPRPIVRLIYALF
mmetsp:Transcript_22609/g.74975  ORF Transcript_22609/g.74975 Transcript_22609/m.74975 type:complete len:149 (-) Transcript_22609:71-517(-)